jgi:hypothetical protein
MANRQTEIPIETERIVITGAMPKLVWCEQCNDSSFEVSLQQAVLITRTSIAELQQAMETRRLHHWRGVDGKFQVCFSSLANASS